MKFIASIAGTLATFIAVVSTAACPVFVLDEPKMPEELIK